MNKHQETYMTIEELGASCPDYHPTFDFSTTYIDSSHEFFANCPVKNGTLIQVKNSGWRLRKFIPGWLHRADALKLYELAYFVRGDILELGSYRGLSTTILAEAAQHSPSPKHIYSVDMSLKCVKRTRSNLRRKGLQQGVTTICDEGTNAVRNFKAEGRQFEFAFIDHSHAYDPVYSVCRELDTVMQPGGFCLFHDFNDPRNRESDNRDYGVYQAVTEGLDPAKFEFYGIYGCTALYRVL
ncbi:class I SAM-dependent methyltransferase [Gimesia aquarii]|uniref:Cephalosporin hydroxylase n=1 Tax=Gimesia aquarii TaxID=2527964 RepID=A0A517WYR2_9PLAN|nr:class I SAM-dependent methyltransferase [Gimesia aquarii]QDU10390.1 Cephalosporin hydroxylase [Gimesia aquarii]